MLETDAFQPVESSSYHVKKKENRPCRLRQRSNVAFYFIQHDILFIDTEFRKLNDRDGRNRG